MGLSSVATQSEEVFHLCFSLIQAFSLQVFLWCFLCSVCVAVCFCFDWKLFVTPIENSLSFWEWLFLLSVLFSMEWMLKVRAAREQDQTICSFLPPKQQRMHVLVSLLAVGVWIVPNQSDSASSLAACRRIGVRGLDARSRQRSTKKKFWKKFEIEIKIEF